MVVSVYWQLLKQGEKPSSTTLVPRWSGVFSLQIKNFTKPLNTLASLKILFNPKIAMSNTSIELIG